MMAQAATLEIREAVATPATPIWKVKIKNALPATLITFIAKETSIDTLEFPMARNRAAQEL